MVKSGLMGGSQGYDVVFEVNIEKGRYFTAEEMESGRNVALIGYEVAQALFPNGEEPIGKTIKIKNLKYVVIGVIKKEGQSFMGTPSNDYNTVIPYQSFRRLYQTGTGQPYELTSRIGVKGNEVDVGLVELENEVRGILACKTRIASD